MENPIIKKNKEFIKRHLQVDDFTVDVVEGEINRLKSLSLNARHPLLFYGILSILTNILYPLVGLKRKVETKDDEFIFVSCTDSYFRTKTINLIASTLRYCIIYLPTFHVQSSLHYHKFFNSEGIRAYYPTVKLRYVLSARRKVNSLTKHMVGLCKDFESQKIRCVIAQYLIYDGLVKDYLKQTKSFKGKWILEHQKFFFIPSITNLHERGIKTTMLQHGVFFKPYYDFIPLICDEVLCCSERERLIYNENGVAPDKAITFGAPLQSLGYERTTLIEHKHKDTTYRLLLAMTIIDEHSRQLTQSILDYVSENYDKVLIRLRPRSREKDAELLQEHLEGFDVSEVGSKLKEDIEKCDKVISFSADVNFEIMKLHKQFLYVRFDKEQKFVGELNCVTEDNYKEEIIKLMESDTYSTFREEQYKEVFGETDVEVLRQRFVSYIKG